MSKPILMFTWNDVRCALENLAEASQERKAALWLDRVKQESETLTPVDLLVEIISTAILLGAETPQTVRGFDSLFDS